MPDGSSSSPDPDGIFGRTLDLLGPDGFERLQRALVVVVGLGGVGSHAANALARAGVGRLRLVDFDRLTASSLNRQLVARRDDVGQGKARALAEHLAAVSPAVAVEPMEAFFHTESAAEILRGPPDFVVDAIDSFTPKVALLRHCVSEGLPVVSSMGASARTDPTLLRIGDLSETRVCPLARAVRRRLAKEGIRSGFPAVFSVEAPLPPLPPDDGDAVLSRGRVRNRLPSLSYMPGIFGYAAASVVILQLSGHPPGEAR
jgi:tRNA A37 threonylcarbamoyladenosine dehydratase